MSTAFIRGQAVGLSWNCMARSMRLPAWIAASSSPAHTCSAAWRRTTLAGRRLSHPSRRLAPMVTSIYPREHTAHSSCQAAGDTRRLGVVLRRRRRWRRPARRWHPANSTEPSAAFFLPPPKPCSSSRRYHPRLYLHLHLRSPPAAASSNPALCSSEGTFPREQRGQRPR